MRRLVAILLLVTAPAAFAARRRAVAPPEELAVPAADSIAATALAEGVPGMTIAVRKGDRTFTRAYGSFDREANVPARTDSVYSIASVTKQFTAAAMLRLEDEGTLSVGDKARKFLPELDERFDAITIRHLLNHTSGVRDYGNQLQSESEPKTQQEIFAMITRGPPIFPAGFRWLYSNSGYFLLGMIIERASARTYEQYLRETFFTPLGLTRTSYCGESAPPPRGYNANPDDTVTLDTVAHPSLLYAAGAICSTAADLVRWNTALAASPSYARMTAENVQVAEGIEYGFGLLIDTYEGRTRVWHNGGIRGFSSYLVWFPEERISVAVLMNVFDFRRDRAGEVANAIARSLFAQSP